MFKSAKPIWLEGMEHTKNLFVSFEVDVDSLDGSEIHICASFFYRLFVNGNFLSFGPARSAKGYTRKDILDLSAYENGSGKNKIIIEVAGYNCRSLSTCLCHSFLCAEILKENKVIAFTGRDFIGTLMNEKVRCSERYSAQRHFGEVWDYTASNHSYIKTVILPTMPKVLDRVAPYPVYNKVNSHWAKIYGTFQYDEALPCKNTRSSFPLSEYWGVFNEDEISYKPFRFIQKQKQTPLKSDLTFPITLNAGEYLLFDLEYINCGFLDLSFFSHSESDIVIGFTEYCENNIFNFTDINAQNVIEYITDGNKAYTLKTFEPYTLRFAILMLKRGSVTLSSFGVTTFERDMKDAFCPDLKDPVLNGIRDAAIRTFAHNAVDIYTDCPSRERAGWLCDSYFTAKAEYFFFGKTLVEDAFLQNYYLYPGDGEIPCGMLPMCYPSDSKRTGENSYIPQWNMWYVIEAEEYINKRNPGVNRELFRKSIEDFLDFLERHENEDGMLEDLPGWNFVEWSDANKWTQNVNYPTNFLYAETLRSAYRLFGDKKLLEKAEKISSVTKKLSFDGTLFTDNAVRINGVLKNTGNTSEACQYYALLFGDVDIDAPEYESLKNFIKNGFSSILTDGRKFVPVNAFIGLYLRISVLLKLGYYRILIDDTESFFGGMVEKTGTLWEYRQMKGSFDHGFASFVLPAIYEAKKHIES